MRVEGMKRENASVELSEEPQRACLLPFIRTYVLVKIRDFVLRADPPQECVYLHVAAPTLFPVVVTVECVLVGMALESPYSRTIRAVAFLASAHLRMQEA